jgi:RNA polymerase sigma factor (sigma-70 family)
MKDPESTYLENLASIERIAAFVARKAHLSPDDTAEFVQIVRVRLFENDYAIIRKFEERSSFTTYLTTVIVRLFHQWRVEQWGKWRPSAEARRLGDTAITLERLLTRDGYTFSEAVKTLTMRSGANASVAELEAIYARLPNRSPRPGLVFGEVSPDAAAVESDAGDRVEARDRERTARRTAAILDKVLQTFDEEDRLILKLRFWKGYKVPEIARDLHLDPKKLYKRLDKLFAGLRRALEAAGVRRSDIEALLGRGDHDIHLDVLSRDDDES